MIRHPRRARRASALLLVASLGLSLPAAEAADPKRSHPEAQKRFLEMAARNRPAGTMEIRSRDAAPEAHARALQPEAAFRAAGDVRDPRTYAKAVRALIERHWNVRLPDPSTATPNDAGDHDAGGLVRMGLSAGDLDGDGLADAMSYEYSFDYEEWSYDLVALRGLRGTDGTELWSASMAGAWDAWPLTVGDLDGDGADDVLLMRLDLDDETFAGTCAIVACAIHSDSGHHWTFTLLGGADGAEIWTKRYDGRVALDYAAAGALVAAAGTYVVHATNAGVLPMLSGDHDGDGSPDLVMNTLDIRLILGYQYAGFLAGALLVEDAYLVTTRAELISGASGAARLVRTQENVPGGALLLAAGDAVGDPTGDLLWETVTDIHSPLACVFAFVAGVCGWAGRWTVELEMLDGSDLTTAWTTDIDAPDVFYAATFPASTDLTDDGKHDILLYSYTGTAERFGVISGASGSVLWETTAGYLIPVGSIDGGAGSDLVALDMTWWSSETVISRLDGATGAAVGPTTTRDFSDPTDAYVYAYLSVSDDTDGDGVDDMVIDAYAFDEDSWDLRTWSVVESGATGATLYDVRHAGEAATYPAGDMDADGRADLLQLRLTYNDDAFEIAYSGISVVGAAQLWSRTDSFTPCFGVLIVFSPDQSGAGGADQIYSRVQCQGDVLESRIDGVEQATGTITWGYGSALTAPTVLGAITGTAIGLQPYTGICADAWRVSDDELTWAGGAYVWNEPTYRIGGLITGDYKVEFWDCDGYGFDTQWFDQASSVETATLVPVISGEVTQGIDAVMGGAGGDPPANDHFADAAPIVSDAPALAYTGAATVEDDEAQPSCAPIGRTVWYRFTAASSGIGTLDTLDSDFDTVIAVYTGTELSNLSEVACSDDIPRSRSSLASWKLTAGETYHVQAGGWLGYGGDLRLTLREVAAPA